MSLVWETLLVGAALAALTAVALVGTAAFGAVASSARNRATDPHRARR
jgi:hypothetical protein